MKRRILLLFCLISCVGFAQNLDSVYYAVKVNASYKVSSFDFSKRFKDPFAIGIGFSRVQNNIIYGLEGNYWFGAETRNDSLVNDLTLSDAFFVGENGEMISYQTGLQGFDIGANFDYRFAGELQGGWYASGYLGGYWYKTLILLSSPSPSFNNDLRKGYDQLVAGGLAELAIAYKHISNTYGANYSFSLGYQLGIGQSLRGYNYQTQESEKFNTTDGFLNLKFSYYFPIAPNPMLDEFEERLEDE